LEQLVFELAPREPPRFSNFLPGRNEELVGALRRFAAGEGAETSFLVWGASGAGKTHLLEAAVASAADTGAAARYYAHAALSGVEEDVSAAALVAVDRVDEADPAAAARLFTLYNALKQSGGRLLAASVTPLAALALREDLRTRLGWGLVYEVSPLADEDKRAALATYARRRGFELSPEVIDYLLRHGRRDMRTLLATLAAVDRLSLASKRAITVPLLKEWLQREARDEDSAPAIPPRALS
jgi:DnaA family protein